jgi:hypothetical protein
MIGATRVLLPSVTIAKQSLEAIGESSYTLDIHF